MVTPVLLPGEPPVGRAAADAHEGGRAVQRPWSTRRRVREARLCRPIGASLNVQTIEEKEIAREASGFLGELADENGFGDGRDSDVRRDEGITPGRRAVPYVLRRRIVVGRDAIDEISDADRIEVGMIGEAQLGIVDADRVGSLLPG